MSTYQFWFWRGYCLFGQKLLLWIGGWVLLKIWLSQSIINVEVGSNAFFGSTYQSNQLCFWRKFCLMTRNYLSRWVGGWIFWKLIHISPELKLWSGLMYFWYLLIKSSNFTFDEDAALLPEIACLDESVAGFPKYIGISAPNLRCGWVQCIFGVYLSK